MKITFKNPNTHQIRIAPIGFSWTCFFFTIFPAAFRGNWKWFFLQLVILISSCGLSVFVFPFIYNKLYAKDLVMDGFKVLKIECDTMELAVAILGLPLETID